MRQILLASAAAMVIAGVANAAEPLEPVAPPPPPQVEPFVVPTWAGPYIGADLGWGWADFDRDDRFHRNDRFLNNSGIFGNGLFDDDDEELDGVVGGVFAGWLGQSGTFLYGVELFAQIADINHDDDDDHHRFARLDGLAVGFDSNHGCFLFDPAGTTTPLASNTTHGHIACEDFGQKVHALFGLEGMIGWGGERAALLLHAGPALGWFQQDDNFNRNLFHSNWRPASGTVFGDDDDNLELGVSVAAEGRFKLTERVFAGVIGRAFWFPDVGDDDDRVAFGHTSVRHHDDDNDVTVFEVKARIGVMFGQPPAAAPVEPEPIAVYN